MEWCLFGCNKKQATLCPLCSFADVLHFFSAIWCAFNSFCSSPFLMRIRIFSVYNSPDKTFLQQFHPRLSLSATENRRHSLTIKVKMETKPDFLFGVFSYECLTSFFSTLIAQERWSICVMELLLVNFHTNMHDRYVQVYSVRRS